MVPHTTAEVSALHTDSLKALSGGAVGNGGGKCRLEYGLVLSD